MAIASLVLGILSLIFLIIPAMGTVIFVLTLVGIVLGALGRSVPGRSGIAIAGLVCCIVAFIINLLGLIACGSCSMLGACMTML